LLNEQEDYNRIDQTINYLQAQLQYYQAVKESYDSIGLNNRLTQERISLDRYAREIVYPLIKQSQEVAEAKRLKEQEERSKQELRELRNGRHLRESRPYYFYKKV
jgi:hypothetical protein